MNISSLSNSLTIVIRHVNERTLIANAEMLEKQFQMKVNLVTDEPFAKNLVSSFNVALNENKVYALFVDGDVLPHPNIKKFVDEFLNIDTTRFFGATPLVWDKFFRNYRSAGIHIYRNSIVEKGLSKLREYTENIEDLLSKQYRPETYFKNFVHSHFNLNWAVSGHVSGLHDFEQNYTDLFRTGIQYSQKFPVQFLNQVEFWKSQRDDDFKALLAGFRYGLTLNEFPIYKKAEIETLWNTLPESKQLNPKNTFIFESFDSILKEEFQLKPVFSSNPKFKLHVESLEHARAVKKIQIWIYRYGIKGGTLLILERITKRLTSKIDKFML